MVISRATMSKQKRPGNRDDGSVRDSCRRRIDRESSPLSFVMVCQEPGAHPPASQALAPVSAWLVVSAPLRPGIIRRFAFSGLTEQTHSKYQGVHRLASCVRDEYR